MFKIQVLESEDGGRPCWEAVVLVRDLLALHSEGSLKIGNIRPDHEIVGYYLDGSPKYAATSARIAEWSEALIDGTAILGNLTWNANPDFTRFAVDIDENGVAWFTLHEGAFDTEIDSASRHRAIKRAANNVRLADGSTGAADRLMDRKLSVRIYSVQSKHGGSTDMDPDSLVAEELFTAYQNWGASVNQSTTKFHFQKTPVQRMLRRVVDLTPHLGDNVEIKRNSLSGNSTKVVAYGTWSKAGEELWRVPMVTDADVEREAQWLAEFWDELVRVRPELGVLSQAHRRDNRETLISATALGFYGFMALASRVRGEEADFAVLEHLKKTVILPRKGYRHEKNAEVDFFDFDNPLWEDRGVVNRTIRGKSARLVTHNNYQSRREVPAAVLELCGFAT